MAQNLTGHPRESLSADAVRSLLTADSVTVSAGLDLLDGTNTFVEDISDDLVSGSVSWDNRNAVHGSCRLAITRQLAWGRDRVRPWMEMSDGSTYSVTETVLDRSAATVERVDDTTAEWAQGTLTNVVASGNALQLATDPASPTTVPGLLASFDASALGLTDGAAVPSLASGGSSGLGWTAQNGGVVYRAAGINGRGYFQQSGSTGTGLKWAGNLATTRSTIIYVAKQRGTKRVLSSVTNNWLMGWWDTNEGVSYAEGWVRQTGSPTTSAVRIFSGVSDAISDAYALYQDGALLASNNGGTAGPNGLSTNGGYTTAPEYSDSDFYAIYVYDHVLTTAERATVHSYLSNRFGITVADYTPQYRTSGVRVAPALPVAGMTQVDSSAVAWTATTPTGSGVTVETSVDDGASWQPATNGGPVAGIAPGVSVLSRVSLTGTGANTPAVTSLSVTASQSAASHTETRQIPLVARFNLGVFVLTAPDTTLGEDPITYQVTGYDLTSLLQSGPADTYTVTAGTTYFAAARAILAASGIGSQLLIDGTAQDTPLPATRVWALIEPAPSRLRMLTDLFAEINYERPWPDENGNIHSRPFQPVEVRGVEWALDTSNERTNIVGEDRTLSVETGDIANWWRFVRADMETMPVEGNGIYTPPANQSDGPTSIDALGRVVPKFQRLTAADQASLKAQGDKIVAQDKAAVRTINLSIDPLPIMGFGDVFQYTDAGSSEKIAAANWTINLDGSPGQLQLGGAPPPPLDVVESQTKATVTSAAPLRVLVDGATVSSFANALDAAAYGIGQRVTVTVRNPLPPLVQGVES